MEASSIIVNCEQNSSWLYMLIWGCVLPVFVAYVASAAYALERRRSDSSAIYAALIEMRALTMLALDRLAGEKTDVRKVREMALGLVSRVRLEMLNRPEEVQKEMHDILDDFIKNAEVAEGKKQDSTETIIERMTSAERRLFNLLRQLTVFEALRQAWINPGVTVSFESLVEKFIKSKNGN